MDPMTSSDGLKAYSQSEIVFGLFGLELDRLSRAHGWGIRSNLSHPGAAQTNLLAARPGAGRDTETGGRKLVSALSSRGILLGTVETARLPARYAATAPEARPGGFHGPSGLGRLGGPPAEQKFSSAPARRRGRPTYLAGLRRTDEGVVPQQLGRSAPSPPRSGSASPPSGPWSTAINLSADHGSTDPRGRYPGARRRRPAAARSGFRLRRWRRVGGTSPRSCRTGRPSAAGSSHRR